MEGATLRRAGLVGVVAALAALAAGELTAALLPTTPSPLDGVGQQVIPRVPDALTAAAIAVLGGANRVVLITAVVGIAGFLAALAAAVGPRTFVAVMLAAAGVGVAAGLSAPQRSVVGVVLVHLVAVAVGLAAAAALRRLAGLTAASCDDPPAVGAIDDPRDPAVDRRRFLVAAGASGGTALSLLLVGRGIATTRRWPQPTALPAPARSLPPVSEANELAVHDASPILTPNDRFFRIDTALRVPRVDHTTWRLRITGLVDRELELDYDALLSRELVEADVTLACVSNEVGGSLVGTARWLGVPLDALLAEAGVRPEASQIVGRSVDGWTAGFPVLDDGRTALVAVGMNGEVLPARHGFPARLVVAGLFGYVSATKWLREIELTTWDAYDAYWVPRGWAKQAPIKISSRIDVPRNTAEVTAGELVVAGVAWAPPTGVGAVEVRVDDGDWTEATLTRPLSGDTWVGFSTSLPLARGEHHLEVRAIDTDGTIQPPGPRPPAPDGAEGWHRIRVTAT